MTTGPQPSQDRPSGRPARGETFQTDLGGAVGLVLDDEVGRAGRDRDLARVGGPRRVGGQQYIRLVEALLVARLEGLVAFRGQDADGDGARRADPEGDGATGPGGDLPIPFPTRGDLF